jgi:hypothetical protein
VIANSIAGMRSAIVSALTRKRHRPKMLKPENFMMLTPKKKKKTSSQMLQMVEMLNAAFGGTDARKVSPKKKGNK